MSQPISVAVNFSSTGQVQLQRGAEGLDTLTARLTALSSTAGSSKTILNTLTNDINRFGAALRSDVSPALRTFNTAFEKLYGLSMGFAKIGLAATIGQFTALGFAMRSIGKDFLNVNQRFGELEITLRSVYGSTQTARALRDEIAKITIQSPLKFTDIANTVRGLSVIPQISSRIGQQAYSPGGYGNSNGYLQQQIKLIEQLTTFRPDRSPEDALFSIRAALNGQMRSFNRSFDISNSSLVNASGIPIGQLEKNPNQMMGALHKLMDSIISPQAIEEMARQPSKLFQNIAEQLKDIPYLKVGKYGEDSGKAFYDRFLDFFYNSMLKAGDFISHRFEPIAKRLSESLNKMFDTIFLKDNGLVEGLLNYGGVGKSDMPGIDMFGRISEGIAKLAEGSARALPGILSDVRKSIEVIVPIISTLASVFGKLASILADLFRASPVEGFLGLAALKELPAIVRGVTGVGANAFIQAAQSARLRATVAGSGVVGNTATQVASFAGSGAFIGYRNPSTGRFTSAPTPGVSGSTGILSGIGGMISGGLIGSLVSGVIIPVIGAAVAAGAITLIAEKVSDYFQNKRIEAGAAALDSLGITDTSVVNAQHTFGLQNSFLSNLFSGGGVSQQDLISSVGKKKMLSGSFSEDVNDDPSTRDVGSLIFRATERSTSSGPKTLQDMLIPQLKDYVKIKDALDNKTGFDFSLESDKGYIIKDVEQAKEVEANLKRWISNNLESLQAFVDAGRAISPSTGYGDRPDSALQEKLDAMEKDALSVKNPGGFIASLTGLTDIGSKIKNSLGAGESESSIQEAESVLDKLRVEADPLYYVKKASAYTTGQISVLLEMQTALKDYTESHQDVTDITSLNQKGKGMLQKLNDLKAKGMQIKPELLESVSNMASPDFVNKLSGSAVSMLQGQAQGGIDQKISDAMVQLIPVFSKLLEHLDTMTVSQFNQIKEEVLTPAIQGFSSIAEQTGNKSLANTALGSLGSFGIGGITGDESPLERSRIEIGRLQAAESFFSTIKDSLDKAKLPNASGAIQTILDAAALKGKEAIEKGKTQEEKFLASNRQAFASLLPSMVVDGPGSAAESLRRMRVSVAGRLNTNNDLMPPGILSYDSPMKRDAELQVAQQKALSGYASKLGDKASAEAQALNPAAADYTTKRDELEKLAESYYSAANAADKFVAAIQGEGGTLGSLANGVTNTLSTWSAEMQNFTQIGVEFTNNFASGMSTAFSDMITKSKSAKDAFKDFAVSFLDTAVNLLMQKAVQSLLGGIFSYFGGGIGAVASTAIGGWSSSPSSANGPIAAASGGLLPGSPSKQDNMMIYAASGEYVIPTSVVQKYGKAHFDSYLTGNFTSKVPHYADGGMVSPMGPATGNYSAPMRANQAANVPVSVNVNITNTAAGQTITADNAAQKADSLARGIQLAVQSEILRQHRQGGIFTLKPTGK